MFPKLRPNFEMIRARGNTGFRVGCFGRIRLGVILVTGYILNSFKLLSKSQF